MGADQAEFTCEIEGLSIVLVGRFNPGIIQPSWLIRHELVGEREGEAAEIEIIRSELSVFTVAGMKLTVQAERFQVETLYMESSPIIRDLTLGIFRVLAETPVRALGLNRYMHFRLASKDLAHRVGHSLVPKEVVWDALMEDPGTRSVVVRGNAKDSESGKLQFTVEPSSKITHGVYIGANEHYDHEEDDHLEEMMEALSERWDSTQTAHREMSEQILRNCLAGS